jgi:serine protease
LQLVCSRCKHALEKNPLSSLGHHLLAAALFAGWVAAPAAEPGHPAVAPKASLTAPAKPQSGLRWLISLKAANPTRSAGATAASEPRNRIAALALRTQLGLAPARQLSSTGHSVLLDHTLTQEQITAAINQLRADPDVAAVEPDYRVQHHSVTPNDPGFSATQYDSVQPVGQWYLKGNDADVRSAINAQGAWPYSQGDHAVVVAVLDTGVRFDHPDLLPAASGGRLLPGYDFVSADSDGRFAHANDGDGWDADASDPGDWVDDGLLADHPDALSGCSATKSSWHGTRTAALIGAWSQNERGIAAVDWRARLLPVRVLGRCGGHTSDIIAGIRWAAGLHLTDVPDNPNPAKIINLSLGHTGSCTVSEQAAIDEVLAKGVIVVASAGNGQGAVEAPGNCRGVIAVGGLRHSGTKVGFSSLGAEVSISAPAGNCINVGAQQPCLYSIDTATNAGLTTPAENTYTTQLKSNVGTSFAAPLVSGVAALMLAVNPLLTPTQVKDALKHSANPFPTDPDIPTCPTLADGDNNVGQCNCTITQCGAGMLNAQAAIGRINPSTCFFSWAERSAPVLFPSGSQSHMLDVYEYRHYPPFNTYLAITGDGGRVVFLDALGLKDIGSRKEWFAQSGCL